MPPSFNNALEDTETEYARDVRSWVIKVPIGLGLCPWAGTSYKRGLLRIATCGGGSPVGVAQVLEDEIKLLLDSTTGATIPPLSTTLLICPHVKAWAEFQPFDDFIRSVASNNETTIPSEILDHVTLVAFHPKFVRWHALPDGIGIGSIVQSHWGIFGKKSVRTATATVIETNNNAFGLRKVKVRFHDVDLLGGCDTTNSRNQEQFVPTDWIDFSAEKGASSSAAVPSTPLPLPDNVMHRSPYPTIHIIVNRDLASLCIRDISRVKRMNAQRMAKLGWDGVDCIISEKC